MFTTHAKQDAHYEIKCKLADGRTRPIALSFPPTQAIYGTASVRYRLFPPGPVTTIEL